MHTYIILLLNLLLFCVGLAIILTKRSTIFIIIGIELILQAAISNCITFDTQYPKQIQGQMVALFSTAISVCEIVLILALCLRLYQHYKTSDLQSIYQ